jgi:hypothetical protein
MHYPGIKYQTKIELAKNILQKVIRWNLHQPVTNLKSGMKPDVQN